MARKPEGPLRRGWTTGACATAATRAATTALLTGAFPDPVTITLPARISKKRIPVQQH
jgi:cobalt-precorrin-5B (C1)-methyltransferase